MHQDLTDCRLFDLQLVAAGNITNFWVGGVNILVWESFYITAECFFSKVQILWAFRGLEHSHDKTHIFPLISRGNGSTTTYLSGSNSTLTTDYTANCYIGSVGEVSPQDRGVCTSDKHFSLQGLNKGFPFQSKTGLFTFRLPSSLLKTFVCPFFILGSMSDILRWPFFLWF